MRVDIYGTHTVTEIQNLASSMRRAALSVASFLVFAALALLGAGEVLSRPAVRTVGPAPADLHADSVRLSISPSESIVGWFALGDGRGSVLLLHGVRADRRQMVDRARFLRAAGYTTWTETERIFAASNPPKELWAVPGAGHVDLYAYGPAEYRARILSFLAKHLRQEAARDVLRTPGRT